MRTRGGEDMTFGRTLQELTRLCGVKRCNLADALGYDPSYISRWINGVKHPSLRSNDALPAQIAAYLTANAAPDVRARIAGQFDLRCDAADDAGFSAALASLLADTIAADRAVDRPRAAAADRRGKCRPEPGQGHRALPRGHLHGLAAGAILGAAGHDLHDADPYSV